MRRAVSVILVIWWLLCVDENPYAQTIFIPPYEPHNTLLEKDNLLQIPSPEPGNKTIRQIDIEIGDDDIRIEIKKMHSATARREVFKKLYNKPKVDEAEMIREEWKKAFGIDVWYPYYKAKAVEKWVKKKLTVRVFKLKGEPQFKKGQALYTFKVKF